MSKNIFRLGFFILVAVLSVFVGHGLFPPETALGWYKETAYWTTGFLFLAFLVQGTRWVLPGLKTIRWRGSHGVVLGLVVAGTGILHLAERHEFKIYADEILLAGMGMQMHREREVSVPTRAYHLEDQFVVFEAYVDKRPPAYPFLVATLHDLSGFRAENSWVVNALLTPVLLFLAYRIGAGLGSPLLGYASVLMWISIPQLARSVSGGGMETLNLVLLLTLIHLSIQYLKKPAPTPLSVLLLATALLAYTRYESILFVLPVALLIAWSWWQEQAIRITPTLLITPVFFIPWLWLFQIYRTGGDAFQTFMDASAPAPYALQYIPVNLGHALSHFLDFSGNQPGNPYLFLAGSAGLFGSIMLALKRPRAGASEDPAPGVLALYTLGLLGLLLLLTSFYFGKLDGPIRQRHALPFYIPLIFGVLLVIRPVLHRRVTQLLLGGFLLVQFTAYALPTAITHPYSRNYMPARGVQYALDFGRRHAGDGPLVLSDLPTLWILREVDSISFSQANSRLAHLQFLLRAAPDKPVYLFQRFHLDPETGSVRNSDISSPSPRILTTVQDVRFFNASSFVQLSWARAVETEEPFTPAKRTPPPSPEAEQAYWSSLLP